MLDRMLVSGLWLIVLLSACVARPPQLEFEAYRSAFNQAEQATAGMLDELVVAERRHEARTSKPGSTFDPSKAAYYATTSDPPLSRAIRRGFIAVRQYNDLLLLLAEGRSFDEVRPSIARVTNNVAALTGMAGLAIPGLPAVVAPFTELLGALKAADDRQAFSRIILEQTDKIIRVVDAMINSSPNIFNMMTSGLDREIIGAVTKNDAERERALRASRESYRGVVANWVVLLEGVRTATIELRDAVQYGSVAALDAAAVATWSDEMRVRAEGLRAALITLRATF